MSSSEFDWQSLLDTDAPKGSSLQAALFTTYDRADALFLVEHLLPKLLRLDHAPDPSGAEQKHFLIELDHRLKQLHGRLVIVSSTAREEPSDAEDGEGSGYPWIWRSIRHLTVGSRGRAVQHAKLWLLHWRDAKGTEYLEIVVSSANLIRAAFTSQLQAAWRAFLKLDPKATKARPARWGVLPDFVRELAAQAGEDDSLEPFVEILGRAECPPHVKFVASVPGTHARGKPWGAAGLGAITPPGWGTARVAVLCPFVGSWGADALGRWCDRFEGSPDRLSLVWIDREHPWARDEKWRLPEATLKTLDEAGADLLHFRHHPESTDRFHEKHHPNDIRWGHAKIYSFTRGPARRLLVTSANFSPAAWGRRNRDGTLTIENFELGVCVEQADWCFDDLQPFDDVRDAATVAELPARGSALISWARAAWNGKRVEVDCRCEAGRGLAGVIRSIHDEKTITGWTKDPDGLLHARTTWVNADHPPSLVRLTCGEESLSVPVFDEREWNDRKDAIPSEVADEVGEDLARIRDELLFERYGGRTAADGSMPNDVAEAMEEDDQGDGFARRESYSVAALELARTHFAVVDTWVGRVAQLGTGESDREWLRRDGELLKEAFQRQEERDGQQDPAAAVGARLAAEELALRLKHYPEA